MDAIQLAPSLHRPPSFIALYSMSRGCQPETRLSPHLLQGAGGSRSVHCTPTWYTATDCTPRGPEAHGFADPGWCRWPRRGSTVVRPRAGRSSTHSSSLRCLRATPRQGAAGRRPSAQDMNRPPSTLTVCPVMYAASSEAKNATRPATSSGVPTRFNGIPSTHSRINSPGP